MLLSLATILFLNLNVYAQSRTVEIYGNTTLGYYYLEAYVGTPPQKKALIIDTGSHITIFDCEECLNCGKHLYQPFKHSVSSSFEYVTPNKVYFNWNCNKRFVTDSRCTFTQLYSENSSYSGYYAVDNFLFENEVNNSINANLKHIFGCAILETNLFISQEVDGIIGFGVSDLVSILISAITSTYHT